jgi:hypothetical protein
MASAGEWLALGGSPTGPPATGRRPDGDRTSVNRWLVLDISMPFILRPLRRLITRSFDQENVRTMTALKTYAEAQAKRS